MMNAKFLQTSFLVALIALSATLTFFIFRPFLIVLVVATIFAVILQPLYRVILRGMDGSPGLAAFVTMLLSVVCILVPLTFITLQITDDATRVYSSLSDGSGKMYLDNAFTSANQVLVRYVPSSALSPAELSTSIDQHIKDGLSWIIQSLGGAFGEASRLLLSFFIFIIALYYLLRDGTKLKRTIIAVSPLPDSEDRAVLTRLELAVRSIIQGSLAIALVQGVLTGIGFSLFGIPNGVLWGLVAAFSALIPGIGTSLVLGPGIIYLFIIGATTPAVGLLVWSIVAVGMIDNFLGPRLMGKGMQLHPFIVLLSVFGGLALFGPSGVFLGPLCISLFFALLSIYQNVSKQPV
ncbi:MAG: AI-2E family transporter [Minisyncoccia bacterium]